MTITKLKVIAQLYEDDLRNFRLSGNIEDLYNFIQAILDETQENPPNYDKFFDALTSHELAAYHSIIDEIGSEEGNISIVKMIQKTNFSRPVFTSLLQKMEKYNVAIVKNQGVKGTHIIFINKK